MVIFLRKTVQEGRKVSIRYSLRPPRSDLGASPCDKLQPPQNILVSIQIEGVEQNSGVFRTYTSTGEGIDERVAGDAAVLSQVLKLLIEILHLCSSHCSNEYMGFVSARGG